MHPAVNYSVPRYPGTPMPTPRQRRISQTISSAFSACASSNEDWTKMSDFGERRRIQNRIAQRNYRIKQKQRSERAEKRIESSPPTLELTHEELATPRSASDLSHSDSPQQEIQNFYDISTPEAPQQQCPPLSDDCVMLLEQFTPQLSTPQPPCTHSSTSRTASCLFHTGGQQQPTHNFDHSCVPKVPQHQCPSVSDDCVMPLQQFTPQLSNPQPRYAHASTSGSASCPFHTGSHQQPSHNFDNSCAPKVPQQQCQPLDHDCVMLSQQLAPQLPTSQPPCACTPTPGPGLCHSQPCGQQQRMHNFYDGVPPCASWAGSEDFTRTSYGQFEPSCGMPAMDLNSPFISHSHPSSQYMASLPPTERGCCCHHNHTYPPAIGHAVSMDSFDMHATHPYQDTAQGHMLVDFL